MAAAKGRDARAELAVSAEVAGRGGVTHVRLEQRAGGLRVYGAYAKVAVSARGEVMQHIDALVPSGRPAPASISARDALAVAMAELGYEGAVGTGSIRGNTSTFAVSGDFHRAPTVEQVAFASEGGLSTGYLVETWSLRGNQLDHTLVDGIGAIVSRERRTANDRYNVFVEDPLKGPQVVVNGPGGGNAQSPAGWLSAGSQSTHNITGNNVHTYLDTDANNAADPGGTAVTNGDFLTAANLAVQPSTTGNKEVAVQNLFYLNNYIHDALYGFGFDEAAGNFQTDNFGKGGAGNDAVNAEAQDGSGTDNANFATPADGSAPRMQMYLWSGASPTALVTVAGADYGAYASSFGAAPTLAGVSGALQVYSDGTGVSSDACEAATVALTGKLAIVDRGSCNFTVKVLNAQKAGAIGVVIVNNSFGAFAPGGTERRIKIPSAMVSQDDGATLRTLVGTTGTLRKNPAQPIMVDGDVDSDIVFHEYGHGLTWRMIGGMDGKLAGAIGEGASDVTAFLINGDDRIGEYSYSNPMGIRRYPYSGYPLTYIAVTGGEVHNDGEIYAGAMWRVLQNYLAAGLTASDLNRDFVDGMNYTPSRPAFENMRDGMLSAAGAGRACLIWRGFAQSGIGVGASGRLDRRGNVVIVESFTLPSGC